MISLVMLYCLAGEPCARETLAIFPQDDIGGAICEIAKPAIAEAIRSKAGKGTMVTFSCDPGAMPLPPVYAPSQRDNRVTMAESEKVSPVNAVLGIIQKLAK